MRLSKQGQTFRGEDVKMSPVRMEALSQGERERLAPRGMGWGWPFAMGLITLLLGVFALGAADVAGFVTVFLLGLLLLGGGIAEIVFGVRQRGAAGAVALPILSGVL